MARASMTLTSASRPGFALAPGLLSLSRTPRAQCPASPSMRHLGRSRLSHASRWPRLRVSCAPSPRANERPSARARHSRASTCACGDAPGRSARGLRGWGAEPWPSSSTTSAPEVQKQPRGIPALGRASRRAGEARQSAPRGAAFSVRAGGATSCLSFRKTGCLRGRARGSRFYGRRSWVGVTPTTLGGIASSGRT